MLRDEDDAVYSGVLRLAHHEIEVDVARIELRGVLPAEAPFLVRERVDAEVDDGYYVGERDMEVSIGEQIENIVQDLYRFQAQYNAHNPDNRFYLPDSLKLDNRNIVSGQYDMNTIRDTVERLNDYHTALFTADDPHEIEY